MATKNEMAVDVPKEFLVSFQVLLYEKTFFAELAD